MSIRCDIYDRKQYDIWFAAAPYAAASKPAKSLKQWATEEKADVVYNLALFNMTGSGSDRYGVIKGRTLQYLKAKGRDCGYGGTPERLVLDASNAVSGWKLAIKDGKVNGSLGKSDRRPVYPCSDFGQPHRVRGCAVRPRSLRRQAAARTGRRRQHRHVSRVGRLPVRAGKRGYERQAGVQRSLH